MTASSVQPQSSRMRLCMKAFEIHSRWAERYSKAPPLGRYPGGVAAIPWSYHRISPTYDFVRAGADGFQLAFDHQALRARAVQGRWQRRTLMTTVVAFVVGAVLLAFMAYQFVLTLRGHDLAWNLLSSLICLYGVVFVGWLLAVGLGRHEYVLRTMESWASLLRGQSGVDDVGPVVDWVLEHWPWLTPPDFLTADNAWALGHRNGLPFLIVAERPDSAFLRAMFKTRMERGPRAVVSTGEMLARLSMFFGNSSLRTDAEAQHAVRELAEWGYGVVATPAGVYVYGVPYERALRPETLLPVVDKVLSVTVAARSFTHPLAE